MKQSKKTGIVLLATVLLTFAAGCNAADTQTPDNANPVSTINQSEISAQKTIALAREAYLYATPLIYTDITRLTSSPSDNTLVHIQEFPDHTFKRVVAPNNDTNYSIAFLELSEEPVVIEIPDTNGRYYVFPLQDAWTNNFVLPGKRTTGTGAQKYIVTGPNWQGEIPTGLSHIKSPTNLVWAIGRIQVNSPEDQKNVVAPLQQKFVLKPLSKWQAKTPVAASRKRYGNDLPADIKGKNAVELVKNLSIEDFFNYFNALLADNPPALADSSIINRIARLGIGAGQHFSLTDFDAETRQALNKVTQEVYQAFNQTQNDQTNPDRLFGNDTRDPEGKLGDYKTNYNLRAFVAYKGLGALPPEEAIYYSYYADNSGEPLHGKHVYRIHFERNQLPPAEAFWSYTVYGQDRYLVDNPIKRYAIGDRDKLKYNADGSLDLWLAYENPGDEKAGNWLPVPNDVFNVTARVYIPTAEFLQDRSLWQDPKPEKIQN
ncbi:MAG: DUF1254 domain-containing protein [Zoogloeaceae bacterium]|jgi:hypothetical protein|nr:DUF1254 domain-containing protein [Zoogloeaceae bacterium]